jgi:6-phosphogluconolactonase (cycloisomerase 2 family)
MRKSRLSDFLGFLPLLTLPLALAGQGSGPTPPPSPYPEILYGVANSALLNYFVAATINPATGAFSSTSVGAVPVLCSGGMVAVNAQFLFISAPPTDGCAPPSGQLLGYSLNQTTGAITPIEGSPFSLGNGASPQGLASAPKRRLLYAADTGRIDAFTVNGATGVPTPLPGSPFASGANPQLVVDPSGKFLYASDDNAPGGVLAFTIDAAGALSPIPGSPFAIPGQTIANSRPWGIVDTGAFIYVSLTATNQIAAFSVDSGTGVLTPVLGAPFSAGKDPAVLALANNFLYVVNEQDGSISGYSIGPGTGVLTPVPGSPFTSDSATITADISGKYLYVSKSDGIQGYNIDPTTGALTPGAASLAGIDGSLWLTVVQFVPLTTTE